MVYGDLFIYQYGQAGDQGTQVIIVNHFLFVGYDKEVLIQRIEVFSFEAVAQQFSTVLEGSTATAGSEHDGR